MTGSVEYLFGEFRFEENRGLFKQGSEVGLPPRVHSLLLTLLRANGLPVPTEELIMACAKGATNPDNALARAVYLLRRALGDKDQTLVRTEYGRGLKMGVRVQMGNDHVKAVTPDVTATGSSGVEMIRTAFELASQRTDQGLKLAAAVLKSAHERFPDLALAPSLQADVEIARMIRGYTRPAKLAPAALKLVEVALSIQPNMPSALASKGFLIGMIENNPSKGLALIDQAEKSAPMAWLAAFYKAWLLIGNRQLDAAKESLDAALLTNPLERGLVGLKSWILCAQERFEEALAFVRETVHFRPDVDLLWIVKSLIYLRTNRPAEAKKAIAEALRLHPDDLWVQSYLAWINAKTGHRSEAIAFLSGISKSATRYLAPTSVAAIRSALNDPVLLEVGHEKARADKDPWRLLTWCDPRFTQM